MVSASIPKQAQLSESAEHRNCMAIQFMSRLQHKAWRAANILNKTNTEVVIVCIQVDSCWRELVESLMPGNEPAWQEQRILGKDPVAFGTVTIDTCKDIADIFPNISDILLSNPEEGIYKGIVLNEGGCTVIDIC